MPKPPKLSFDPVERAKQRFHHREEQESAAFRVLRADVDRLMDRCDKLRALGCEVVVLADEIICTVPKKATDEVLKQIGELL